MKFALALVAVLALAQTERLSHPQFEMFMQEHGKNYESEVEHNVRYLTFFKNMGRWELLNKAELGSATYGANEFADLTEEEFREQYLSPVDDKDKFYMSMLPKAEQLDVTVKPAAIDWREKNAVTPVKNQGMCGSCWAFGTVANIEGLYAIRNGTLESFSEQELVDCDRVDFGCNGGLPFQAVAELMRLGGLMKEADYPYKGVAKPCKFDKTKVAVTVSGREHVSTDEEQIAAYVAKNGPVSIGVNAAAMQFYMGGVSHPWSFLCSASGLDHAVTIVGYGTDGNKPFWNIKNSWGPGWGEKGYYRLYRGDGSCGCNQMVTSAIL